MDDVMNTDMVECAEMQEEMLAAGKEHECGCEVMDYGQETQETTGERPREACHDTFFQKEKICVPVKVTPFAMPGEAKVTCCGKAEVVTGNQCTGDKSFCGFTVTQALCIEIPISFGAKVETGIAVVQCGTAGTDKCDCR